jgi:aspartyl-tRNA(Asn)/glutamyl-tRNA(Gln) amidotransferase subunit A
MCHTSPSLDTIGLLTRSAADAAHAFAAIEGIATPEPLPLGGLRLGRPVNHFFDNLDDAVAARTEAVLDRLAGAGAEIVPVAFPEVAERLEFLSDFTTPEFLAVIGRERLLAEGDEMTPLTVERTLPALDVKADAYIRLVWRRSELASLITERMRGLDAWLAPTIGMLPPTLDEITDVEKGLALEARLGLNTHNVSLWGLCAASVPVHEPGTLPIGLQVVAAGGADARLLAICRAIEAEIGAPPLPDLAPFLA